MTQITILLLIAALGFTIAHRLKTPAIPLLLLGGITLSTIAPTHNTTELHRALELGITFLLFASGIELNPQRFGKQKKAVLWVATLQFLAAGITGYIIARTLKFTPQSALHIAAALSTSSTLIAVRILQQNKQKAEPFARLTVGVLLFQDLLIILLITLLPRLPHGPIEILKSIIGTAILGATALIAQRWIAPWLSRQHKLENELLLLTILAQLFLFTGLANTLNLPSIAGAFAAGLALSPFPINGVARSLLTSLNDFFLAIFFTALGAFIGLPDNPTTLLKATTLALTLILITPPLVAAIAQHFGLSTRNAIEAGLLLAQTSELSLVLAITAHITLNTIPYDVLATIAYIAAITMTLTPLLANDRTTQLLLHLHPTRKHTPQTHNLKNHILILGFGTGGMWVAKPLLAAKHKILVIDDDPTIIQHLQKAKIPSLHGDGSDPKTLHQANIQHAQLIISSMRRPNEANTALKHAPNTPTIVRVFETKDAQTIQKQGGIPILNSEAAAQKFIQWFNKTGRAKNKPTQPT